MKIFRYLSVLLVLLCITVTFYGQGCSDAGFCTISNMKTNYDIDRVNEKYNQVKIGISNGKADHDVGIWAAYLEYSRQVKDKLSFAVRFSSISQSGKTVTSTGFSDVFISTSYLGVINADLILGLKIPFSDGNKMKDDLPLPMDFQSSLGTVDLVLGAGYAIKRLKLTIGIQQPLTQNSNSFLAEEYPIDSEFYTYQSTNKYLRKGDALFRISYGIGNKEKFIITPSILAIYHLANDEYTNAEGVKLAINGSQGLTLNGNLFVAYSMNESNMLELSIGAPFITRKARPDGLTRKYVLTLEYRYRF